MPIMMQEHPHLPLLQPSDILMICEDAHLGPSMIAKASGFSRQVIYLWMKDPDQMKKESREVMSAVAYRVRRAVLAGKLPMKSSYKGAAKLGPVLADDAEDMAPLGSMSAQDLLPILLAPKYQTVPRNPDVAA